MAVKDFIVDNDIDILAMTETWLRPGTVDSVEVGTLCPTGYRVLHVPRSHSAGGGVGIIFKNSIRINTSLTDQFHSFELMDFHLSIVRCVRILLVYRPPGLSTSLFLEEFSKLLEYITADLRQKQLLIVGDFNVHVDNPNDTTARQFLDILDYFNLVSKWHVYY